MVTLNILVSDKRGLLNGRLAICLSGRLPRLSGMGLSVLAKWMRFFGDTCLHADGAYQAGGME